LSPNQVMAQTRSPSRVSTNSAWAYAMAVEEQEADVLDEPARVGIKLEIEREGSDVEDDESDPRERRQRSQLIRVNAYSSRSLPAWTSPDS
jgi:hypothetical protein